MVTFLCHNCRLFGLFESHRGFRTMVFESHRGSQLSPYTVTEQVFASVPLTLVASALPIPEEGIRAGYSHCEGKEEIRWPRLLAPDRLV